MRITERFTVQHKIFLHQLELLGSLLAAEATPETIVAAVRTLSLPLLRHAEDEELVLFPALGEDLGTEVGPLPVLVQEHERIHGLIERVGGVLSRAELADAVRAFIGILEGHIAKEEDVLFPMAERILGDARLGELDTAVQGAVAR